MKTDNKTIEEVEKAVLNNYLRQGYRINNGEWGFEITTRSQYRDKRLCVVFYNGVSEEYAYTDTRKTFKKLFSNAIKFFNSKSESNQSDADLDSARPEYLSHKK